MKLHHFRLTKAQLSFMPEAERNLFILLAHAANELNVLIKIFSFCSEHPAFTEVEKEARNAQAMTIGRLLTGKLYECWRLLQKDFFGTKLSQFYGPLLDSSARASLDSLKKYFGRKNIIEAVRNRHAFHYSSSQVSRGFNSLTQEEPLNVYVAVANANTLYAFADIIAGCSLIEEICQEDPSQALNILMMETAEVLDAFNEVVGGCMMIMLEKYIGGSLRALESTEVDISVDSKCEPVTVPYFINVDR